MPKDPFPQDTSLLAELIEGQFITELRWNTIQDYNTGDPENGGELYYDIYFGRATFDYNPADPDDTLPLVVENYTTSDGGPAPFIVIDDILDGYQSGLTTLWNSTTYYWKVSVTDEEGAVADGPIWTFTTDANNTVPPPELTNPDLGEQDIPLRHEFTWSVPLDYDADTIKCDFYIDTGNDLSASTALFPDLTCVSVTDELPAVPDGILDTANFMVEISDQTIDDSLDADGDTNLTSSGMLPNAKYYWKVVAKDFRDSNTVEESETHSDVWNFDTDAGYFTNTFAVGSAAAPFDFLVYDANGVVDTVVANVLPTDLSAAGASIDSNIGMGYPSLLLNATEALTSTTVNLFDEANLNFDMLISGNTQDVSIFIEDTINSSVITELVVRYDVPKIHKVTCQDEDYPGAAGDLIGDHWILDGGDQLYHIWYTVGGAGGDPGTTANPIPVAIASAADPAATVASLTAAAIASTFHPVTGQHAFDVAYTATNNFLTITNRVIGDSTGTDSTIGTTGWPTGTGSIAVNESYVNDEELQTHLYARSYDNRDQYEDYKWTRVGAITYGWINIDISLVTGITYDVSLDGAPVDTITYGELIADITMGDPKNSYTKANRFRILANAGAGDVWIDNLYFEIDPLDTGWFRSIY